MSVTPYLWVMHQPLCAVAYSHSCAFFAGLVLRAWGRGLLSSTFQLNLCRFGHTSPCPPA